MATEERTLDRVLDELKGLRTAVDALGKQLAAHPESDKVHGAMGTLRLLEERQADDRRRIVELESERKAMATRIEALEKSGVGTGVTITAAHKIAGAILGLIVASLVWFAARATAPAPTFHPPPNQPTQAAP